MNGGTMKHRCMQVVVSCVSIGLLSVALQTGTAGALTTVRSVVPLATFRNQIVNMLEAVSCASPTYCVAVGSFYDGKTYQTVIESSSGGAWSVVSSPNETPGANYLKGVSCTSSTNCVAVGNYYDASNEQQTLVESWNGTVWSIVSSPDPSSSYDLLNGVSCTSSSDCVAVGAQTGGALVESWDGTAWSVVPNPDSSDYGVLEGVSCTGATSCMDAGTEADATLTQSWNGTEWSDISSPNGEFAVNLFTGVSCTSSVSCVAVGYSATDSSSLATPITASWNGTQWSSTYPNQDTGIVFEGVSCTGSIYCVAVGSYYGPTTLSLIETWNGTAWTFVSSPGPRQLNGASCLSSSSCVAAGYKGGGARKTYITSSNGSAWSNVKSPNPVIITSFKPTSGPPGSTVTIKGGNLERANLVTFNGVGAAITRDEANRLVVTVPAGATTGVIEVTTQGGSATSSSSFTVT
jgi:hypothetical protein